MWYILDEKNKPVEANITEYVEWEKLNRTKRIIKQESIRDVIVSTIFLGLDHSWDNETPLLWETMIFGGEHDQYQARYTSYDDAVEGHESALALIKTN